MDDPEELAGSDVKARLPIVLQRMIEDGSWATGGAACDDRIPISVARQWDPAAIGIHLQIPCLSIADEVSRNPVLAEIWNLSDIDPEQCFAIGDFGMGSDNPIVIDLSEDSAPIRTQQWEPEAKWITIASSFNEFCALLGM